MYNLIEIEDYGLYHDNEKIYQDMKAYDNFRIGKNAIGIKLPIGLVYYRDDGGNVEMKSVVPTSCECKISGAYNFENEMNSFLSKLEQDAENNNQVVVYFAYKAWKFKKENGEDFKNDEDVDPQQPFNVYVRYGLVDKVLNTIED